MKTFHKTVTGVILAICMVYLLLPQGNVLAIEQSIRDNATEVSLDQAVTGTTTNGNDVWYIFNASAENRSYTITFHTTGNTNYGVYAGIYDQTETKLGRELAETSGNSFTVKPPLSEPFYIKVSPQYNNNAEYAYTFTLTSRADEPDTKETAEELDIRQVKLADLCTTDDVDFYKFTTGNESLRYEIKAAGSNDDSGRTRYINVELTNASGVQMAKKTKIDAKGDTVAAYLQPNATYYIKVTGSYSNRISGEYSLQMTTRRPSFLWSEDASSCKVIFTNTEDPLDKSSGICNVSLSETINPTCVAEGRKIYLASYKNIYENDTYKDTKEVAIPAKGHRAVTDAAVKATCTTPGKTEGSHCSVCDTILVPQQETPIVGHNWSAWSIVAQPTVFVAGEQEHRCSVCYATEFEVIPKLKATAKLSPANKTVKAGKSYTLKISKLAQGDSVKSVTAPKKAKLTIKKVKNNQYRISGKKKGTFKVTVKLQSKAKFTCKVKVK